MASCKNEPLLQDTIPWMRDLLKRIDRNYDPRRHRLAHKWNHTDLVAEQSLLFRDGAMIYEINLDRIRTVKSIKNSTKIFLDNQSFFVAEAFRTVGNRLDPIRFHRVSKTVIVNTSRIASVGRAGHHSFFLILDNGERVKVQERYIHVVRGLIGAWRDPGYCSGAKAEGEPDDGR